MASQGRKKGGGIPPEDPALHRASRPFISPSPKSHSKMAKKKGEYRAKIINKPGSSRPGAMEFRDVPNKYTVNKVEMISQ